MFILLKILSREVNWIKLIMNVGLSRLLVGMDLVVNWLTFSVITYVSQCLYVQG